MNDGTNLPGQPYAQLAVSEDASKVVLLFERTYGSSYSRRQRDLSILLLEGQTGAVVFHRTRAG